MVKRYPSFSPVPSHNSDDESKSQFWQIINCARADEEGNLRTRGEIRDLFQDPINGLLKVSGGNFPLQEKDGNLRNPPMPNDLLSMVIALGLLDGTPGGGNNQEISWNIHSAKYISGEEDFPNTIHNAMLDKMATTSGDQLLLELLYDIWRVMDIQDDESGDNQLLKSSEIIERLQDRGWDDRVGKTEKRSIGLALRYATIMGLFESEDSGNPRFGRGERNQMERLRRVCAYWNSFHILRVLGTSHPSFKTDEGADFIHCLFRYHLFRECGGQYRQRKYSEALRSSLQKFAKIIRVQYRSDRQDVSSDLPLYNSTSAEKNPRKMVENHRSLLKEAIEQRFGVAESDFVGQMSVDVLSRAYRDCQSRDEALSFFRRNSGGRYDKSILSDLASNHGGSPFSLAQSFVPYSWQEEASDSWKDNGFGGIVAAVTGSGKTIMAIYAISEYVRENPTAVFSIIVPTKVLMYQWAETISALLGIDDSYVGFRGDGFKDSFSDGKRVVVSIVNSARGGVLAADIDMLPNDTRHVIIADECHRFGGESNRTVFDSRHDAILGLSATPPSESEDEDSEDSDDWTNAEVVIDRIGEVFYNLRYKEALEQELISPFEVIYLSIPLDPIDDLKYENHTKRIGKAIKGIRAKYGHLMSKHNNRSLDEQLNAIEKQVPEVGSDRDVRRYREEAMARRELVWNAPNRKFAYLSVIEKTNSENPESQVMVFHEQISQLEDIVTPIDQRGGGESHAADISLANLADEAEYAMYHSKQNHVWNSISMDMFRQNSRKIMLSVKALAEGVDVPSADVGIIRVSTGSVRQRIQTIGRMLRKSGAEKATIYIFHVTKSDDEPTVDCNILRTVDWKEQLGEAEILHSKFIPPVDEKEVGRMTPPSPDLEGLPIPPSWEDRLPPAEVDVTDLELGDEYPGRFDGTPIGVDASGQPFIKNRQFGRLFLGDEGLKRAAKFVQSKKGGGKILLTAQGHLITRVKGEPTYFLGTLDPDRLQELENESLASRKERPTKEFKSFEEMFGSG